MKRLKTSHQLSDPNHPKYPSLSPSVKTPNNKFFKQSTKLYKQSSIKAEDSFRSQMSPISSLQQLPIQQFGMKADKNTYSLCNIFKKNQQYLESCGYLPIHKPSNSQGELLKLLVSLSNPEDFNNVFKILQKSKDKRTEIELQFLQRIFHKLTFFYDLEEQVDSKKYQEIFRHLKIEYFKSYQLIFNYGSIGKKFYIVLSGKVFILIPSGCQKPDDIPKSEFDKIMQLEESLGNSEEDIIKKLYPNYTITNFLNAGNSFGEIALRNQIPRTATVICGGFPCHLATLSSDIFQNILKGYFDNRQIEIERFQLLRASALFSGLHNSLIQVLLPYFTEITFKNQEIIYKEGESADFIYFIKSGLIELTKLETFLDEKKANHDFNSNAKQKPAFRELNSCWNNEYRRRFLKRIKISILAEGE